MLCNFVPCAVKSTASVLASKERASSCTPALCNCSLATLLPRMMLSRRAVTCFTVSKREASEESISIKEIWCYLRLQLGRFSNSKRREERSRARVTIF